MNPGQNPIDRFNTLLVEAAKAGLLLPEAMCLATTAKDGKPSARMMLLKGATEEGFVFYTNCESRKGQDLKDNPFAALCFWWPTLERQVRVEGPVIPVSEKEADTYFVTRPRGSQLGAWASRQSSKLSNRDQLLAELERVAKKYEGRDVPRPPHWSGFVLKPERIEFWFGRPDRLHERYLYTRRGKIWHEELLSP